MSTLLLDDCLYLSALLVLVIFGSPSIRKRVSCKSEGIKLAHVQHVLWTYENPTLSPCPMVPRDAASRSHNSNKEQYNGSSSNCCSNSCPWLWLRKIARKWLFELIAIATVSNRNSKKWKGLISDIKSTSLVI